MRLTSPIAGSSIGRSAPQPTASTLNFGDTPVDFRANAAMLRIGAAGFVSFFSLNGSHVIADTTGYFLG